MWKKILRKKHSLWVQALKKDEDQQVQRKLCHNIYWIQKITFQKCKFMKSIFVLLSTDKITKTISLKVFKILDFKIMENRLIISTESSKVCNVYCFFNCFSTFCGWIKTLIPYFCLCSTSMVFPTSREGMERWEGESPAPTKNCLIPLSRIPLPPNFYPPSPPSKSIPPTK